MPFTFEGDYIPNEKSTTKKAIKICLEKRRGKLMTKILNLPLNSNEMQELASLLKKMLGTGGSVKNDTIEVQGNRIEDVKKILKSKAFKV